DAVLLGLDRVVTGARADDLDRLDAHLHSPGRPRIAANLAGESERRLQRQLGETLPDLRGHLILHHDALHDASTVAYDDEGDLARRSHMGHPPPDRHDLPGALAQTGYALDAQCHC